MDYIIIHTLDTNKISLVFPVRFVVITSTGHNNDQQWFKIKTKFFNAEFEMGVKIGLKRADSILHVY